MAGMPVAVVHTVDMISVGHRAMTTPPDVLVCVPVAGAIRVIPVRTATCPQPSPC
jgi:hypothetical protein